MEQPDLVGQFNTKTEMIVVQHYLVEEMTALLEQGGLQARLEVAFLTLAEVVVEQYVLELMST